MLHGLISVIVPFYNLEDYVHKCLDSILAQTYTNIEIIAVDDGSSDKTFSILNKYANKDARIVLVKQDNAGAGVANNKAISLAKGEFIAFVDNDDWIEPTMYENMVCSIRDTNSDMVICNFNLVYDDHVDECYSFMRNDVIDIHDDVYGYFCTRCACPKPNNYIWSRLYKADIIKNSGIRFESFNLGADTLFNFKLLPLMKRVSSVNKGFYNYVQRMNSCVFTAANKGNLADIYADSFDSLAMYYLSNGFDDFLKILPILAFTRLRSVFFYSRLAGMNDEMIVENIKNGFSGREIAKYLTAS